MKGREKKEKEENKNVKKKRGDYRLGPPASPISSLTCTLTMYTYKISARHRHIRQSLEGLVDRSMSIVGGNCAQK